MTQLPRIGRVKAAAIALALGLPVSAFAGTGPYVGLEGGANWEGNQNVRDDNDNTTGTSTKFKPGWLAGGVAGYSFANGLRPEVEVDFRRNQFRKLNVDGVGSTTNVDGFEENLTGMANIWYDLKTSSGFFSVVHPYIGGGVGISRFDVDKFAGGGATVNGFDTVFAYQGGAGIGYDITRHLTASIDWRYLETLKGTFDQRGPGATSTSIDAKYRSNSLMGGLRYSFGGERPAPVAYTPPPPAYVPPPPAPGPCSDRDGDGVCDAVDKCPGTPRGFKVDADGCIIDQKIILRSINFEFNKDVLTAPAMSSLDEVGAALVGQPSLKVEIAGYTDSVGSPAYNLKLSKKRAASVKSYLVGKGVPSSNLVAEGYGEKSPIADNKTEEGRTDNRRVEFSVLNKPANANVVTKGSTEASKSAAEGDPVGKKTMKKHKKRMVRKTAQ